MTQLVHRHTFTIADAVSALLPDVGDCDSWQIRVEGDQLVIDVVAPASKPVEKINTPAPEADRKGGPLAQRAGIICGEKGFWTFAGVRSSDEAAIWLREQCGIKSRVDLDHEAAAAAAFHEVDRRYRLWLEGFDV
jgi:hypothetical protein